MTAFELAQRFIGELPERPGSLNDPFIVWCLESTGLSGGDEIPWCSAFVNRIAWLLRLPRSKSALARSWLAVGAAIHLQDALVGYDVVILKRGIDQPDASDLKAPGHVGFFGGLDGAFIQVVGGNQGNNVSMARFPIERVLGIRRLK